MKREYPLFPLLLALIPLFSALLVFAPMAGAQQQTPPGNSAGQNPAQPAATPPQPTAPEDEPVFAPPTLPGGKVSLVGGNVEKLDRVRNRLTLKIFGGREKMTMGFDERTHFYRDGTPSTYVGIRRGDRVYVDSMLDNGKLFARNVRVVTQLTPADARGQLESVNSKTGAMIVRDELSDRAVEFRVTPETTIKGPAGVKSLAGLRRGALLSVRFFPDTRRSGIAREVAILAMPGASYVFSGRITHLDMRTRMLAIENRTDNKIYDIKFDATSQPAGDFTVGTEVTINAEFDGRDYRARTITITQARAEQPPR